jgi:hypothetical protein
MKGTAFAYPEPEFLKHFCVEAGDGNLDEATLMALYQLRGQVEGQLGQLVVFPRRFIR